MAPGVHIGEPLPGGKGGEVLQDDELADGVRYRGSGHHGTEELEDPHRTTAWIGVMAREAMRVEMMLAASWNPFV